MPEENQSQRATIRAQKAVIERILVTPLPVPEGDARQLIARIDAVFKGPYFKLESHPPLSLLHLSNFTPPEYEIAQKTAALNMKREKLVSLLADYEFQKSQLEAASQSTSKSIMVLGGFTVGALLLALGLKKYLQRV